MYIFIYKKRIKHKNVHIFISPIRGWGGPPSYSFYPFLYLFLVFFTSVFIIPLSKA